MSVSRKYMGPPSCYGWVITWCRDDPAELGTMGPHHIPDELAARLKAGEGERFRLLDGDGHTDYEGCIILPPDQVGPNFGPDAFAPLDEFGESAGSAEIQYLNPATGEFEPL